MRDATSLRAVHEPQGDAPAERPDATRWVLIVALLSLLGIQAMVVFFGQRDSMAAAKANAELLAAMKEETASRNTAFSHVLADLRLVQFESRSYFERIQERADERASRERKASDEKFEKLLTTGK